MLGMFAAGKFIRPYGQLLKDIGFSMKLRGEETSAADVHDALVESINNVFDDVVKFGQIKKQKHPMEYELYHNEHQVVDGPW